MATPRDPDVYIQYYDTGLLGWRNIIADASAFSIRDAGLLKIPIATVDLLEPTYTPPKYSELRILENDGDGLYNPFYGRVSLSNLIPLPGTANTTARHLVSYGLEKRLKHDSITWEYQSEQDQNEPDTLWSFKAMIEDFLGMGDTGYDTGFTLDTDSGAILNKIYGNNDFDKTSLLDAIRTVAETIGYDGYIWVDGSTPKVKFAALGSLYASPSTLTDPFIGKPELTEFDIDAVKNYILVHGGVEIGYPTDKDRFTENGLGKYNPHIWEPLPNDSVTTLIDYAYPSQSEAPSEILNRYSLNCIRAEQLTNLDVGARLRIDLTGISSIDLNRYSGCAFWGKSYSSEQLTSRTLKLCLTDTSDNKIRYQTRMYAYPRSKWKFYILNFPLSTDDIGTDRWLAAPNWEHWVWETGSDFDFEHVKYCDIVLNTNSMMGYYFYIDWFHLVGAYKIDPFQHPVLNPPVTDATSINDHGPRIYHHTNDQITTFQRGQYEGQRVLDALKDELKVLNVSKLGCAHVRPSQVLSVTSSHLGISSEFWRLLESSRSWYSKTKVVVATLKLVPQYAITPPIFAPEGKIPVTPMLQPGSRDYKPR